MLSNVVGMGMVYTAFYSNHEYSANGGDGCHPADLIGLAFSYVLSLNQVLYGTIFLACFLENRMVSVERIIQYTNVPSEAPLVIEPQPPSSWPSQGTIVLENLKVPEIPAQERYLLDF